MTDSITAEEFARSDGVVDWNVTGAQGDGAVARFATGSFTAGVELIEAISELAEAAGHHPDVDLRFGHVLVRLVSHDIGGLSRRDVDLARQISAAARELDIPADDPAAGGAS